MKSGVVICTVPVLALCAAPRDSRVTTGLSMLAECPKTAEQRHIIRVNGDAVVKGIVGVAHGLTIKDHR